MVDEFVTDPESGESKATGRKVCRSDVFHSTEA